MQPPYIRFIPQDTADNNLGPDRVAGPKALDPYYFMQTTNPLIAQGIPLFYLSMSRI